MASTRSSNGRPYVQAARWVGVQGRQELRRFREKAYENLAEDGDGQLVYLADAG